MHVFKRIWYQSSNGWVSSPNKAFSASAYGYQHLVRRNGLLAVPKGRPETQ